MSRAIRGGGARADLNYFLDGDLPLDYAREAVRQASVQLEAVPAPAGTMPVVLGAGWPGILLHEAVGHGLEGDFNRKGTSAFSGKVGQQVASPLCTIVDDGTLPNRRGSLAVDDEGTPGQYNVLVEERRACAATCRTSSMHRSWALRQLVTGAANLLRMYRCRV